MSGDGDEDFGNGPVPAFVMLIIGLLVQVLFNSMTQGQEAGAYFLAFVGFTACILCSEAYLSFPSGLALGIGMLPTSFFALDWWMVGLGVAAAATNLTKYALTVSDNGELEELENSIHFEEDLGFNQNR